jgi:hypothetical protein
MTEIEKSIEKLDEKFVKLGHHHSFSAYMRAYKVSTNDLIKWYEKRDDAKIFSDGGGYESEVHSFEDMMCILISDAIINEGETGYIWNTVRDDLFGSSFNDSAEPKLEKLIDNPLFRLFCEYELRTRSALYYYPCLFRGWRKLDGTHGMFAILRHRLECYNYE